MKKTQTLRRQLNILLLLIVVFQSSALIIALGATHVFDMLDAEAVRLLNNTTKTRAEVLNDSMGNMIANLSGATELLNKELISLSGQYETEPESFYLNDIAYKEAALRASALLMDVLEENHVTGAFVILNGSNSNKDDKLAHSAVYIRDLTPDIDNVQNYQMEIGPTDVSRQYQMPTSVQWNLDMQKNQDFDFYEKPIRAAETYKRSEIERYGYWSSPIDILSDNQQVVCYTLPLLNEAGDGYGVLGVEISMPYFAHYYLPESDLLFHNSFYVIARMRENRMDLSWSIPGSALAKTYLKNSQLQLKIGNEEGNFETKLDGLGEVECSVQTLKVYSDNSPFSGDNWVLSCFVPQNVLTENSASVRETLIYTILISTLLAFSAVFLLVYIFTRKIAGLSDYVRSLSPYDEIHFKPTGMREIDDLTSAVQVLNQSLHDMSKTTSKILELSLLPVGGYEVMENNKNVILTDFIYWLLHIEPGTMVSKEEWQHYYELLTKEKIKEHDSIYYYFDEYENKDYWLRILEAKSPVGVVGAILDVTDEVEENRRLSNELDFDTLTSLHSSTALKREVSKKIFEKPDETGAMVFIDLDNLKYINDNFGHDMGDRLIIQASEIFRYFEKFGGIVSRISGDEFAVYLHGFKNQEALRKIINMLYPYSENFSLKMPNGENNRIRFSAGVAWYPKDGNDVTTLLKLADFAMYEAKHKEKGRLFEFNPDYYKQMSYLLENREAINRLLDEELIRFAFQPIVDLKNGKIYGYEALMRPLLENFKNPLEILAVASAQSKLTQLERLVMMVIAQTIEEKEKEIGNRKIFINSIPNQILSREDFQMLKRRYEKYFKQIVFEIIEKENDDSDNLNTKVSFLRDNDMQIAIDDFGSGYSNEVRILSLMPDIIKIDMEMIQGINHNPDKQSLVSNLVEFCHQKGVLVIAEGIEEKEDLETVIKLKIDFGQGYYLGRPEFEPMEIDERIREEIEELGTK